MNKFVCVKVEGILNMHLTVTSALSELDLLQLI